MKKMDKMTANFVINLAMLPLFLATMLTGIVKFPGLLEALGISARRMPIPMQLLTDIHDWAGIALVVLVFVHLVQHWAMSLSFLKGKLKKRKAERLARQEKAGQPNSR